MRQSFRQGIVRQQTDLAGNPTHLAVSAGNKVDLVAANTPTTVSFAHRNSNYSLTEFLTVVGAWGPFAVGPDDFHLFWDIDTRTGIRTFNHTTVAPTFGTVNPSSPVDDLHFFNTAEGQMKVFDASAGTFLNKIRVFAGVYRGGATLEPESTGSQVAINGSFLSGEILFDDSGRGVRKSNGEFFTTEDQFIRNGAIAEPLRLESNVLTAVAQENMAAFSVVAFSDFNKVLLAEYEDVEQKIIGMTTSDALLGEEVNVVLQGFLLNTAFSFDTPNAELFADEGALVETDPNISDPIGHPNPRVPVARVIDQQSVFFLQGLGGTGPQGLQGPTFTAKASGTVIGVTRLTLDPVDLDNPIAVGDNDPRNSDARVPLAHNQAATSIIVTPAGNISSANAQLAFEELDDEKVAKAGDTMTGNLIMSGGSTQITLPNAPLVGTDATNKTYVDGLFSFGTIAVSGESNVVADSATDTLTFVAGTGMTITTNAGADSVTFAAVGGAVSSIFDADADTGIQVEESADDDTVRIDVGDTPAGYGAVADILTLASGGLAVSMGTSTGATTPGAPIDLTAGNAGVSGDGGSVTITGGNSDRVAAAALPTGGNISLLAGTQQPVSSGNGGSVIITAGSGTFLGTGGNIDIDAGAGGAVAGNVTINAADNSGSKGGGAVTITAGDGGGGGFAGNLGVGGDITLQAGGGSSGDGGSVFIRAGSDLNDIGGTSGGNIELTAGRANTVGAVVITRNDTNNQPVELRFVGSFTGEFIAFKAQSLATSFTITLPNALPTVTAVATAGERGQALYVAEVSGAGFAAFAGPALSDDTETTINATPTITASVNIASGTSVLYKVSAVGREDATGDSIAVTINGGVKNQAGTTSLFGSQVKDVFDEAGSTAWDVTVAANDTSDTLQVTVTGEAAHTIDWNVHVETVEV